MTGVCGRCNAVLSGGAFCDACGAPSALSSTARCRQCEGPLLPQSAFCDSCGATAAATPTTTSPLVLRVGLALCATGLALILGFLALNGQRQSPPAPLVHVVVGEGVPIGNVLARHGVVASPRGLAPGSWAVAVPEDQAPQLVADLWADADVIDAGLVAPKAAR